MDYKKGQVLNTGIQFVIALIFIGILAGVALITLSSFASSQPQVTAVENQTVAGINNATYAALNMSGQLPTVGTIIGVSLILLVVFTAFGYFALKR